MRGSAAPSLPRARTYVRVSVSSCRRFPAVLRCCVIVARARTVDEGSQFCVHHERLLAQHGADALKQGLPRRKQARNSWRPTIVTTSSDEPEANSNDPTGHERRFPSIQHNGHRLPYLNRGDTARVRPAVLTPALSSELARPSRRMRSASGWHRRRQSGALTFCEC